MDPLGVAFENYDAIGRWRTVETRKDAEWKEYLDATKGRASRRIRIHGSPRTEPANEGTGTADRKLVDELRVIRLPNRRTPRPTPGKAIALCTRTPHFTTP